MTFKASREALQVVDTERGWRMTGRADVDSTKFKIDNDNGSFVAFTAMRIPRMHSPAPRTDAYTAEWKIRTLRQRAASDGSLLSRAEMQGLVQEAMSAFGLRWGEGAGSVLLHFD